ncbi:Alpha-1,3-mannosyltransferase-like protein [Nowakowskiella sp. JEL0407]|nr:Alpha-1,3-mannosyltransferase-like protein [Nowakowskiella sp. JEL0407]
MTKLRIAFVHPDLGIGGAERLVIDAAVGLQKKGHAVEIFTSHHDKNHCFVESADGTLKVEVFGDFLPRSIFGRGHIVFAILRSLYLAWILCWNAWVYERTFDIYFVDQISASIPLLRCTGQQILFYCHYPDQLLTKRESVLKFLYRIPMDMIEEYTTKMADVLVVNSKFTASVFRKTFKSIERMPKVLYPGINIDSYNVKIDSLDPSIQPLKTSKTVLLSINRFERKKTIGIAIQAFARLRNQLNNEAKNSNLLLVIAGGYDSRITENVNYLKELQSLSTELHLPYFTFDSSTDSEPNIAPLKDSACVWFLPSFNETQRAYLLQTSTCLIYTPRGEHFGITPVEAMCVGTPVIAIGGDGAGPTESILHKKTGYLVSADPGETEVIGFATAMRTVVEMSAAEREEMGRNAKERVKSRFSSEVFVDRLDRIVRHLGGELGVMETVKSKKSKIKDPADFEDEELSSELEIEGIKTFMSLVLTLFFSGILMIIGTGIMLYSKNKTDS